MIPHLIRSILLGPLLGTCVGNIQVLVAAAVWAAHGQPAFYFRDWSSVARLSVVMSVCGLIAGIPFGAAVAVGELLLDRQVRIAPALVAILAVTAGVTWVWVEIEFTRNEMLPVFSQQALSVGFASGLLLAWSRPKRALQRCD